jgi:hypothetical protein
LLERFPEKLAIGDIRHRISGCSRFDYAAIEEVVNQASVNSSHGETAVLPLNISIRSCVPG